MIIVLRHGRTEANASGLLQGRIDPPLDRIGRTQAEAAAAAIQRHFEVDAVVSSPLLRARQTAAAFSAPTEFDDRWIELDYGDLEGTPVAEVPADMWKKWRTDQHFRPPGGESLAALDARVRCACDDLFSRARTSTIVVTTHVSPIKAALGWVVGTGWEIAWRARVDQAAVMTIDTQGPAPSLRSFNDVSHLRDIGE